MAARNCFFTEIDKAMNTPKTYPIATLRDIFHLDTIEQIEVCMDELKAGMIRARAVSDGMMEAARELDPEAVANVPRALDWPEVVNWVDDGKGLLTMKVEKDGETVLDFSLSLADGEKGETADLR
jgi:hypothetical protein